MMEADRLKENYCQLSSDLLEWIQHKLVQLDDRQFPNRIEGIQGQLLDFKQYRTVEKPPKYKTLLEFHFGHLWIIFYKFHQQVQGAK
jgi:spectrin beta